MADENLFQELSDALDDLKTFLQTHVDTIKAPIQQLASLIPQINTFVTDLQGLLNDLKQEINDLDVSEIPGLTETAEFSGKVKTALDTVKKLLPDEADTIEDVQNVAEVVHGLTQLEDLKADILACIDAINLELDKLKAP